MSGGRTDRDAVLIPTGRQMKSYGCMRSLSRHGLHTVVASEDDSIPHFASRYCDERVTLPAGWRELGAYRDALLELAARPDVKTIIPVRECDVYLFAKYHDAFDEHVDLVTPTLDSLRRGHDRLRLASEAARADVPYAETRRLSEVETWDRDVVVKSRYNILTDEYVDSYPPNTAEEVSNVQLFEAGEQPDVDAITATMNHEPIVQDYIPEAQKYLYCALWVDGEPVATYQHEQLRKISWVGGGGIYRTSAYSEAVDEAATALLSQLEWTGYACIEYVKDERTGEWKFLELNPRVWLSMPEAIRAGVDFPYYYWRCVQGDADAVDSSYETGIHCHASFGELKHLLSTRRDESPFLDSPSFTKTFLQIVGSCLRHPRFDYIRPDDPRFFLSAVRALPAMSVGGRYDK